MQDDTQNPQKDLTQPTDLEMHAGLGNHPDPGPYQPESVSLEDSQEMQNQGDVPQVPIPQPENVEPAQEPVPENVVEKPEEGKGDFDILQALMGIIEDKPEEPKTDTDDAKKELPLGVVTHFKTQEDVEKVMQDPNALNEFLTGFAYNVYNGTMADAMARIQGTIDKTVKERLESAQVKNDILSQHQELRDPKISNFVRLTAEKYRANNPNLSVQEATEQAVQLVRAAQGTASQVANNAQANQPKTTFAKPGGTPRTPEPAKPQKSASDAAMDKMFEFVTQQRDQFKNLK